MKKKIIWSIIILVIIAIVAVSVVKSKKKDDKGFSKIRSVEVEKDSISVKLEEKGEIVPIKIVDIKSKISGKIIKFHVSEGDKIKIGDLIAEVEPDFNQAKQISNTKDELHLAEISLNNAKDDLAENKELYDQNLITKDNFKDYKDVLERAKIRYKSALQNYNLVKDLDSSDNVSKIFSTAEGLVIENAVEEGEMVVSSSGSYNQGSIISRIANTQKLVVNSEINEVDISKIELGQNVIIELDAFQNDTFEGKIKQIAQIAKSSNNIKVFPIEILITSQNISKIRPGMTANITILGESKKDILTIPIRTIYTDSQGFDIVYLVENDTIKTKQKIVTGINNFTKVEVVEGLNEGDKISFSEPRKKGKSRKTKF